MSDPTSFDDPTPLGDPPPLTDQPDIPDLDPGMLADPPPIVEPEPIPPGPPYIPPPVPPDIPTGPSPNDPEYNTLWDVWSRGVGGTGTWVVTADVGLTKAAAEQRVRQLIGVSPTYWPPMGYLANSQYAAFAQGQDPNVIAPSSGVVTL